MTDEEWQWLRRLHAEEEWCCCESPQPMLTYLGAASSNRKFRLFASACARRIWSWLPNPSQLSVAVAERFADGRADESERAEAEQSADAVIDVILDGISEDESSDGAYHAALSAAWCARPFTSDAPYEAGHSAFYAAETEGTKHSFVTILRCIFGNPFRPTSINPSWLTPTVSSLAQVAYDERIMPSGELDPDRLAVLSDALEEAGCDDADILAHLRGSGPHARGCWAVDLLLGKE